MGAAAARVLSAFPATSEQTLGPKLTDETYTYINPDQVREPCLIPAPPLMPPPAAQVNSEGVYRYATAKWFSQALASLVCSGVRGVAVDVWVRRA